MDDVTGKPLEFVKMSATDREKQRIEMVSTINAMILQMNTLIGAVRQLNQAVQPIYHVTDDTFWSESMCKVSNKTDAVAHDVERLQRHQARQAASFKARLVWLLKGR